MAAEDDGDDEHAPLIRAVAINSADDGDDGSAPMVRLAASRLASPPSLAA